MKTYTPPSFRMGHSPPRSAPSLSAVASFPNFSGARKRLTGVESERQHRQACGLGGPRQSGLRRRRDTPGLCRGQRQNRELSRGNTEARRSDLTYIRCFWCVVGRYFAAVLRWLASKASRRRRAVAGRVKWKKRSKIEYPGTPADDGACVVISVSVSDASRQASQTYICRKIA